MISAKVASISASVLAGAWWLWDSVTPDMAAVAQQPQAGRVGAVTVDVVDLCAGGGAPPAPAHWDT